MVKEIYESIKVDVRDKSRNPFIGAFILVWTIRNWEAVYSFFAFDKDLSREERICILKPYFTGYDVWEVFVTIGFALLAIIVSYSLLNITRAIVNLFEKRITPRILEATGYNDVVPIGEYNKIIEVNVELDKKIADLRKDKATLQLEIEELEKKSVIAEVKVDSTDDDEILRPSLNPLSSTRIKAESILKSFTDKEKTEYLKKSSDIIFNRMLSLDDDYIKKFSILRLIKPLDKSSSGKAAFFSLTELGEVLLDIINHQELNNSSSE